MLVTRVIATLLLFVSYGAWANNEMDALLNKVQSNLSAQLQQENIRLQTFKANKTEQEQLLEALNLELSVAKEQAVKLVETFNKGEIERAELANKLRDRSQQLSDVLAMTKKFAADFINVSKSQLSSARFAERQQHLAFINEQSVPTLADIKSFWLAQLQNMVANAGVQVYDANVIQSNGETKASKVYQFSDFAAIDSQGHYLLLNDSSNVLQVLVGQSSELQHQAQRFVSAKSHTITIDPSLGTLLKQSTLVPTFEDRIHQGGIVGYIILGLGALGVLIALWRLMYMSLINLRIRKQLNTREPSAANPLGRVLLAAKGEQQVESAELLIDKALLQEVPKLERCHSLVKLLAAVAPLLGLLGTVTGMIETFQSITLLGASDPKLMAGGISQALITTVMGLCVAIPLLFCHSFISARAKLLLLIVQQQSLLLLSDFYTGSNKTCLLSEQVGFEQTQHKQVNDNEQSALA
jgi:biopolymer transport protein ExbB